jgi:hypothetical protein
MNKKKKMKRQLTLWDVVNDPPAQRKKFIKDCNLFLIWKFVHPILERNLLINYWRLDMNMRHLPLTVYNPGANFDVGSNFQLYRGISDRQFLSKANTKLNEYLRDLESISLVCKATCPYFAFEIKSS